VFDGTTLTFTKRGAPYGDDLTYIIESSVALETNTWTPVVTHDPAQLGTPISYVLTVGPGTPKMFARLKVIQAP
jgi:hypothetical protein